MIRVSTLGSGRGVLTSGVIASRRRLVSDTLLASVVFSGLTADS